jgi:ribosomal protein L11 methyltransferase
MTHLEFSIHCKPENQQTHDILIAYLSEIGFDGFQENEGAVQAFVNKEEFSWNKFSETRELLQACGIEIIYKYFETDDQNWNEEWEKNFVPVKINEKVLIRAPFHSSEFDPPCTIVIEPKMSFGTGILGIFASMNGAESVLGVVIDNWAFELPKKI